VEVANETKKRLSDEIVDRRISFAIVFQICMLITNYTFKHILRIIDPNLRAYVSLVFMILTGMLYFKNFPSVFRRKGKTFIYIYSVSIIIFLLNIMIFPKNIEYLSEIILYYFLINIPTFVFYLAIIDKTIFFRLLIKSAYYQISLVILFFLTRNLSVHNYDMVFSYLALMPVVFLLYKYFKFKKVLDLALSIFGIFAILAMGSRGPIVSIILFFFIYNIFEININKISLKKTFALTSGVVLFLIIIFNWNLFIKKLYSYFMDIGIFSRTIYIFANLDNIDFSAGRISIYKESLNAISSNPILGLGIGGDRVILGGTYPHNIVLEVLINYGVIIGVIIICCLLFTIVNDFIFTKGEIKHLSSIYFSIGFIPLIFSSSYLISTNFWIYLAIIMSKKVKSNNLRKRFK